MGRSLYTPSTAAYLVHGVTPGAAAAASSSSRSSSPSGCSSLADSGTLFVGHEEIKYGQEEGHSATTRTSRRSNKDAPTSWAERSFDPDDENLPVVTERFLAPGEEQHDAMFGSASDAGEDAQDQEEEDSDYGSEDEDEEEQVRVETAEIERIIEEPEQDASTELDEDDDDSDEQEQEGEDTLHGNQGYYDFPAQDRRSTSEIANDASFSPSSAVFHAHTLPFSLPSTDAMQLQRRTSSGYSSSSLARAF